ncbi:peptide-methionine (S)-S-oxide reductase MsrA [Burkholderia dolosa]|uniref:Peptide methionine sulfoxide reductase MsrA n=1 Tax=Burkholderia dolosa TaxID=152500 RepID=A0A892IDN2_9BURK|nr:MULTISPECIES: peptide-methionine (S)-S-oxide reductase MsrA [Burkholderia]AKE02095.1 methionine sulfoxide reductase A [Burkholderia cepacia]AJY11000.1 peptide-methionine (S)-S-oxide reductase [Burkholderia dolosa AU0158]AYZ96068.1 peptide-methionine (S)-S-oxide reductase [Burkholderia dolosa]EAY72144.1 Peptide methionine sulfoxide reductase [Burkholderia dolosa AU0158]MBR8418134.1 peptide-methionine (S)-S-oxide reductase MsrA [Burkholderia dolosa]
MNPTPTRDAAQPRRSAMLRCIGAIAVAAAAVFGYQRVVNSAEPMRTVPAPTLDESPGASHDETAVFAGGCFWGVQGVFEHVKGVKQVTAGYAGGASETARYALVGTGLTGHAESVRIVYDPTQITYGRLLQVFFSVTHDPTQLNRQGPDEGSQYRSAIFPTTAQQRAVATAYIAQLGSAHAFAAPVVTRVEPYKGFYPAEAYHQNYLELHPDAPYIAFNDLPKVAGLKQRFPALYRADAVLWREAGR